MSVSSLTMGPGGWSFAAEGAAVHENERLAVIADVHLGYEWARGAGGDCVVAHSLAETRVRLERLLERVPIERLIVAGDLVESPAPCPRTAADVRCLFDWLEAQGASVIRLRGNHDERRVSTWAETIVVDGWTIAHGHEPIAEPKWITGHLHPVIRAEGRTAPCFLAGPNAIVLPTFSLNAAGWNVVSSALPANLRGQALRCLVSDGEEVLDFGPLTSLAARLNRGPQSTKALRRGHAGRR